MTVKAIERSCCHWAILQLVKSEAGYGSNKQPMAIAGHPVFEFENAIVQHYGQKVSCSLSFALVPLSVTFKTCCVYIYWTSLHAGARARADRRFLFTPDGPTWLCRSFLLESNCSGFRYKHHYLGYPIHHFRQNDRD